MNVKNGGLVIMDIKFMFKTYEAFPYVVYPDPLLHEVAAGQLENKWCIYIIYLPYLKSKLTK